MPLDGEAGLALNDVLWLPAWAGLLAAFVWGSLWGSFLNVVIYRLPRGESLVRPASHCPGCGHPIRAWDNVPLLSWLLLGGRCRDCRARISPRYPLVEGVAGALSLALFPRFVLHGGSEPLAASLATYLVYFAFAAALLAVVFIDLDRQIVPDEITYGGMAVGLLVSLLLRDVPLAAAGGCCGGLLAFLPPWLHADAGWVQSLLGVVCGGGFVLLINAGYARLRQMQGMGMGDAKLLAMIGAFLGVGSLLFVLLLASLLGLGAALGLGLARRFTGRSRHLYDPASLQETEEEPEDGAPASAASGQEAPAAPAPPGLPLHRTAIAFGPYLAIAATTYLLAGQELSEAYGRMVWRLTLLLLGN